MSFWNQLKKTICLRWSNVIINFSSLPNFQKLKGRQIEHVWNPVDNPSAKEQADINYLESQTANNYVTAGAIDGVDVRAKIIADKKLRLEMGWMIGCLNSPATRTRTNLIPRPNAATPHYAQGSMGWNPQTKSGKGLPLNPNAAIEARCYRALHRLILKMTERTENRNPQSVQAGIRAAILRRRCKRIRAGQNPYEQITGHVREDIQPRRS